MHVKPKKQMRDGYKYDVFVSYEPESVFEEWITDLFLGKFEGMLRQHLILPMNKPLSICKNRKNSSRIETELLHSKCLLAICSPTYFKFPQCKKELSIMFERERRLEYRTESNPNKLVLTIGVHDGELFPDIVDKVEGFLDFKELTSPSIVYTPKGVELDNKINQLAAEVKKIIDNAPSWTEEFFKYEPPESFIDSLQIRDEPSLPTWPPL